MTTATGVFVTRTAALAACLLAITGPLRGTGALWCAFSLCTAGALLILEATAGRAVRPGRHAPRGSGRARRASRFALVVADPVVAIVAAWGVVRSGGPGTVALVLVGGAGLALIGRAVRRAWDARRAEAAHLRAGERLTAAAAERARLAREMHDSLSKTLDAIALGAAALPGTLDEPDRASRLARTLRDSTLDAARDARNLIGDLRANAVDAPLRDLVHAITQDWSATTGITATVRCAPVDPPPPVIVELCGILREALRNVAAHADAATVTVTVTHDLADITLTVTDDGTGFNPTSPHHSRPGSTGRHGLIGMAERAKVCGGHLDVVSAPGAGTGITAVVPASGEAPAPPRRPRLVAVGAAVLLCVGLIAAAQSVAGRRPGTHPVHPAGAPARSAPPPSEAAPTPAPRSPSPPGPTRSPGRTLAPAPGRTPTASNPAGAEPVSGKTGCHVRYTKRNEWNPGFIVDITIVNTGTTAVDGWTLAFTFTAGQTLVSGWSATVTQAGADITANDGGITPTIAPAGAVTFGLQGTWHGSDPAPTGFTLNDTRCA